MANDQFLVQLPAGSAVTGPDLFYAEQAGNSVKLTATQLAAAFSPVIGGAIGSGTAKSVLFVDATGNLAQDNANFAYDSASHTLMLGSNTPRSGISLDMGANTTGSLMPPSMTNSQMNSVPKTALGQMIYNVDAISPMYLGQFAVWKTLFVSGWFNGDFFTPSSLTFLQPATFGSKNIQVTAPNASMAANYVQTLKQQTGVIALEQHIATVATLGSASPAGQRDFVTDALAPTFGATVVGGGAVFTTVYSDGTNWKVG